jgi:hypothetical protein
MPELVPVNKHVNLLQWNELNSGVCSVLCFFGVY